MSFSLRAALISALRPAIRSDTQQEEYIKTEAPPAVAPPAPLIGTATAGFGDASVTFTPTGTGGSPITSYTVTSTPGGITATGGSSPIVISGLTNGVAYTFKVKATNAVGTGPESTASNSVTPNVPTTVPSQPLNVVAVRGNTQATISFSAPSSNGGAAITSYQVTSSPGGFTASGAASPLTVTGLTNGTSYTFTVKATNSVGQGPASAASNAVVPATVPGAPTIGTAVAGSGQASVSFTAPASNGGAAISQYIATSNPGGINVAGAGSPINVAGLTNGTAYTFTVVAVNEVGTGAASSASNSVTPQASTQGGPFDAYYNSNFTLDGSNTFIQTPAGVSLPAKTSGYANAGYIDPAFGTRIYAMVDANDMPGDDSTMVQVYSRKQAFNCDGTKYFLKNAAGYHFAFNALTFARIQGHMTLNANSQGAIGTNTFYPRDPAELQWSATDPNKLIYSQGSGGGLTFYEYDLTTGVVTTKFSLVGRLGAFGMGSATRLTTEGDGRPSDDGRYWGFDVYNGSTWLGIMCYDMQTDTILGARTMSGTTPGSTTMAPNGSYYLVGSYETSLSFASCQAAGINVQRGSRCYTKDCNTFYQVSCTANHAEMAVDNTGADVFIGFHYEGSRDPGIGGDGRAYYRVVTTGTAVHLWDLYTGGHGGHVSSTLHTGQPGWAVFSMYETAVASENSWRDNVIILQQLKATSAQHWRAAHTRGGWVSGDYWAEPHATASRDGLKIIWGARYTAGQAPRAMMIGLPSWAYTGPGGATSAPTNTAVPTISQASNVLTGTTGTWQNSPTSFAYQWQRLESSIWTNVGTNTNQYTMTDTSLQHRLTVTATNSSGSNSATSATFTPTASAELLSNGSFASDTVWNKGVNWSIGSGVASHAAGSQTSSLSQAVTLVPGTTYRFGVTVTSNPSSTPFQFRLTGGTTVASGDIVSTGYKEVDLVATSGNNTAELFAASASTVASFDNATMQAYVAAAPGAGAEKITNGDFSGGSTGWTTAGAGWTIANGVAVHDGATGTLSQAVSLTAGTTYRVRLEVSNYNGIANIVPRFTGGSTVAGQEIRSNGLKHYDLVAASGNTTFELDGAGDMTFDNISIRAVLAENLISNGTFASDTVWTKGTGWTIGSGVASYAAGTTSNLSQSVTLTTGKDYRITVDMPTSSANADVTVRLIGGTDTVSPPFRPAGKYWHILRAASGNNACGIRCTSTVTSATFDNFIIEEMPANYPLLANGDFTTTDYWMFQFSGMWSISGGKANMSSAPGTAVNMYQSVLFDSTKTYRLSMDITRTAGTVLFRLTGGVNPNISSGTFNVTGTHTFDVTPNAGHDAINIRADSAFVGTVDNVSITIL